MGTFYLFFFFLFFFGGLFFSYEIYNSRKILLYTDTFIPFYRGKKVPGVSCMFRCTGGAGFSSLDYFSQVRSKGLLMGKVLPVILGRGSDDTIRVVDLARCPHMLVAGGTNMGKTNFVNSVILGLYLHVPFDYLDVYVIDFKKTGFFELRNLLSISTSIEEAKVVLDFLLGELEERNTIIYDLELKNWQKYMDYCILKGLKPRPYIVCVIDEYNSFKGEDQKPVEKLVAQARAVGIYLILCTQYPKAKVMNSEITSQCLTRCCFRMASEIQEKVVLDGVYGVTNLDVGHFYYKGTGRPGVFYANYVGDEVFKVVGKNLLDFKKGLKMDRGFALSSSYRQVGTAFSVDKSMLSLSC